MEQHSNELADIHYSDITKCVKHLPRSNGKIQREKRPSSGMSSLEPTLDGSLLISCTLRCTEDSQSTILHQVTSLTNAKYMVIFLVKIIGR